MRRRLLAAIAALAIAAPALAAASFDHFTGTSAPAGWTPVTSGTGVVCMNGTIVGGSGGSCTGATTGESRLEFITTTANDTAAAYSGAISRTTSAIYWFAVRSASSATRIMLVDKATPAADTTANTSGATGYVVALVQINAGGTDVRLNRYNNARTQTDGNWTDSSKTWTNSISQAMATVADNYNLIGFEIDGSTPRWRLHGCGNSGTGSTVPNYALYCPLLTDWTDFSYHEGGGGFCNPNCGNLKFVLGDIVNNNDTVTGNFEYFATHEGTVQYAWNNQRDNGGTWTIRRAHGYPSSNTYVERFVPADRATNVIGVGGGGAWDEQHVKDPMVTLGTNGTYYLAYSGARVSDGKFQLGFATASSPTGTFTKGAGNPLVALSAGTVEDQVFNPVFAEDLAEPDATKRWKLFYSAADTSGPIIFRSYVRTCSAPPDNAACDTAGEWSAKTELVGPGTGGAIDDRGWGRVRPYIFFGRPFLIGGVQQNGAARRESYATGSFNAAMTKSGVITVDADGSNCDTTLSSGTTTTRTLSVGSTTGCSPDQFIVLDDDAGQANYHRHRILNVVDATTLTLYQRDDAMASGANVRGVEAFFQADAGVIREYAPGQWVRYASCFDPMGGSANGAYSENSCTWTAPTPLGPWAIAHLASPAMVANAFGAQHSFENPALINGPLRAAPSFMGPR